MAKKKTSTQQLRGKEGFELYYHNIFKDRWPALKEALLRENQSVAWKTYAEGKEYFLDIGSVCAALALPLEGASRILDMCAAPGGKTLVLASRMEEDAGLVCNERSRERYGRLLRVLEDHLGEEVRQRVKAICTDGTQLCLNKDNVYDRILLDAPCSSERHVLTSPHYLDQWSPARIKTLSVSQWALLSSGYRMLSPGGYLLYATCALSPEENDKVVSRLEKKFDDAEFMDTLPVLPSEHEQLFSQFLPAQELPIPEKTDKGFHILPDTAAGAGPLYFALIHKKEL